MTAATVTFTPALAQDAGNKELAKPAEEKKICRSAVATGSVMPRRTCHTKAQWDAMAARGQSDKGRVLDEQRSRSMIGQNR